MRRRFVHALWLALCLWRGLASAFAAEPLIALVSSERSAAYNEAAEGFVAELERSGVARSSIAQLSVSDYTNNPALVPKLVVTLGAQACTSVAKSEPRAPTLCTLLPRNSFERVLKETGKKVSSQFTALYLDQPLARQLDLLKLALPNLKRVGVLWGPESIQQAPALRTLMDSRALSLAEVSVTQGDSIFPSLKKVLNDADVILALADPSVYNSRSIQNILLASMRTQVPLVAFSPAYARAGALMALYSDPAQVGSQAGVLARDALAAKGLPAMPVYPQEFVVQVNEHVAHALGLKLNSPQLSSHLARHEVQP